MIDLKSINESIVESNKEKLEKLYRGNGKCVITAEWDSSFSASQLAQFENEEIEYKYLISTYNRACEAVEAGFDNVPVVTFSGDVAWLMALAYGCELIKVNDLVNAAPKYNAIEEAREMTKIKDIWNYGEYPMIFKRIEEFQKRWGNQFITISDNQSPIDVLTCILHSEEAMLGMYDEPEEIHRILQIITESIIEVNRHYEKKIANFAGFKSKYYLPFGMHVSDDNAAFLSPALYNEFAKPYTEILSDEFGGIAFHCCMGHEQNLQNFASTKGFIAFDAMPDFNNRNKVLDAINGKGVWNVYNYSWAKKENREESDEDTFKNIIDQTEGKCGLLLHVYDPNKEKALRLADKVQEYALKARRI